MNDRAKKLSPPYATYGAFSSFINKLRDTGVPSRIDPSVFGNASGSVSYSVIAALKALKLIDDDGRPRAEFVRYVSAPDDERGQILASIVRAGYPSLFGGDIDLSRATAGEFDEHIRKEFEVNGSTVDKVASFFLSAAVQAGIELSPHLKARKPVSASTSSKKSAKQRKRETESGPSEDGAPASPSNQISEKALEYRLVDLMSEAIADPEVMAAIIKVITFLKTKDSSAPQRGAI